MGRARAVWLAECDRDKERISFADDGNGKVEGKEADCFCAFCGYEFRVWW
jgi:hypothetical protein